MSTTHWRITVVDGGNFKTYMMEVSHICSSLHTLERLAPDEIESMGINSIHKLTLERIEERTMKDGEVKECLGRLVIEKSPLEKIYEGNCYKGK